MKSRTIVITSLFIILINFLWQSLMMKAVLADSLSAIAYAQKGVVGLRVEPMLAEYLFGLFSYFLFVVKPYIKKGCLSLAGWSFLYGFLIYGAYNFGSMAYLRTWPWHVVMLSVLWGAFHLMCAGVVAYWVNRTG